MISNFFAAVCMFFAVNGTLWAQLPSDSIYHLPSQWTTQDGKRVNFKDFGGKPVIMTLIYTSCPTACPLTVADLNKLDDKLSPQVRERVQYILVSLDSERDHPGKLKKFTEKYKLDKRWTMLVGTADDVREIAATLGFQYKKLANGEYSHGTTVYLLNKTGQITAKRDQSEERETFVTAVAGLLPGK